MVELEGSEKLFGMVLGMVLILMTLKWLYLLGSSMASLATSNPLTTLAVVFLYPKKTSTSFTLMTMHRAYFVTCEFLF